MIPNPKIDAVQCVSWAVDDIVSDAETESRRRHCGVQSLLLLMSNKTDSFLVCR